MLKTARLLLAMSVILLVTWNCSTPPLIQAPIPNVCFEACHVQTCKLSQYYIGKGDEDRAAEELNCTEVNGSEARYCATLKKKCAEALTSR